MMTDHRQFERHRQQEMQPREEKERHHGMAHQIGVEDSRVILAGGVLAIVVTAIWIEALRGIDVQSLIGRMIPIGIL
jgi:hypothetical protein